MKRSVLLSTFLFAAVLTPMLLQTNYCDLEKYQKLATLELYVPDINGQNVISDFNPDGILYKVELPVDPPDTAVLLVQAQDATATIEVTYDSLPIALGRNGVAPLTLAPDHSEIKVAVMADNKVWTYTVSIDRVDYCPCDDGNACTYDICMPADQVCVYRAVPDGTLCEGIRGGCYGGLCNFVPLSVTVGSKELVFDWSEDRCEDLDLPDSPAHIIRAEDGELVLFASNGPTNYVSRGPDFDTLQRVCDPPALVSADLRTPETYENWEWIWATYREGESWHALILNEFHDSLAPTCEIGDPSPANPCTYWSLTYAVSTDGARSFVKPNPPAHVVAPPPQVWEPPTTPATESLKEGYAAASSIVRGSDDYYYALIGLYESKNAPHRYCLMRTDTLDDPASWRAWDGNGFNFRMESPYATGDQVPSCVSLSTPAVMPGLVYNTYLDRYMAVGGAGSGSPSDPCGIYLYLSSDLIHWTTPQLMVEAFGFGWGEEEMCGTGPWLEPVPIIFPTIIDHQDSTTNFERPGRNAYLYYTRNNGGLDRDLVRVPLTFTIRGPLCEGVDCNDQNECTEDICNGADGSCEHTPVECAADFNDCTTETCDPVTGCQTAVADGTPCAGGTCQSGACALTGTLLPCTEQGIRNAVAAGDGPYTFDCDPPIPIATEAEIVIERDVILHGEGKLIVDGNRDHRVLSVAQGVNVELRGITVTGGSTVESGGGILNAGTLALTNSTISGNSAQSSGGVRNLETGTLSIANSVISQNTAVQFGGGMHNFGQAEIVDTTISNNTAESGSGGVSNRPGATLTLTRSTVVANTTSGGSGGGIGNSGALTVTNGTVSGNTVANGVGGGILNGGAMSLDASLVSGNSAANEGGGISNTLGATATLTRTTVEDNNVTSGSGGGIGNSGAITLTDTTVAGNQVRWHGGGIFQNGTMVVINSTVSGNMAIYGGGLYGYAPGSVTLTNTTVSRNVATDAGGGGIVNEAATMTLVSTTLAENSAAQIGTAIWNSGTVSLRNTIVAGDCEIVAPLNSLGGNIESEGNTCGLGHPSDQVYLPASLLLLEPLQENGGPTLTHALLPGSEAIDWIPGAMCIDADGQPLATDQRGRPRPAGPGCDVGAFEVQP